MMHRWLVYNKEKTVLLYIRDVLPGGHGVTVKPHLIFHGDYIKRLISQGRLKIDDYQLYRELLGDN